MNSLTDQFVLSKIHQKLYFYSKFLHELVINKHYLHLAYLLLDDIYTKSYSNPIPQQLATEIANCLSDIATDIQAVETKNSNYCFTLTISNLDACEEYINQKYEQFLSDIHHQTSQLYCISAIISVYGRLNDVKVTHHVIQKNIENLRTSLSPKIIKPFLHNHHEKLKQELDRQFEIKPENIIIMTTPDTTEDMEILRHDSSTSTDDIPLSQIKKMQQLLSTRERFGKQTIQENTCEKRIASLEENLGQIRFGKDVDQLELIKKRVELRAAINELILLNNHVVEVNNTISDKIDEFQLSMDHFEKDRTEILHSSDVDANKKHELLDELYGKMKELKRNHKTTLELLDQKKNEVCVRAKDQIKLLTPIWDDVKQMHEAEKTKLEGQKINAHSDKLRSFVERIREMQDQYDDELNIITKMKGNELFLEYLEDNLGRYFVRSDGVKVYKANSTASEYIVDTDTGNLIKIQDQCNLCMDEKGDYYLDKDGHQVYTHNYLSDSFGRYYTDDNGRHIYRATPYAPKYVLIDDELVRLSQVGDTADGESSEEISLEDKYLISDADRNAAWVRKHLGKPLRKALAAAVVHQPNDPICYIGNYLLQYRYNEVADNFRQNAMTALFRERKKFNLKEQLREERAEKNLDDCDPCTYIN